MEARREMTKQESQSSAEGARRASGAEDRWPFDEPPDPEVPEKPVHRKFTAEYKLRILAEADACETHGQVGALLRREGLYSSPPPVQVAPAAESGCAGCDRRVF